MSARTHLIKPPVLKQGDMVAAVSLSWGGASVFPNRYHIGKRQLEEAFGIQVIETPNALRSADELRDNPQLRAQDFMWAFENTDIKAVISIIGGDDSVRLIPYLDLNIIAKNPKVHMGYSDTTATHFVCMKAGLSSIYGPTFMAGFGENGGLFDYMRNSVKKTLFDNSPIGQIFPNVQGWTDDKSLSWEEPENQIIKRKLRPAAGWRHLQGSEKIQGRLIGGCVEVLEMLKGTPVWPDASDWDGCIFFLETSEEAPSKDYFVRCLRNYAGTGILQRLGGIILGRAAGMNDASINQYDDALLQVVSKECGLSQLPIMTQMDFGHTDPMFLIPYGAMAEIDAEQKSFSILESAVN